jgi:mRNA-degrading endonuclease YafQ of YafQ-DinJ toxin-antitoxin module
MMQILQTNSFKQAVKKLHSNQKAALDIAVKIIINSPTIGIAKLGDLARVRVYKFHMINQLMLLAYLYDSDTGSITLLALGSHENFYRDLKERI